MKLRASTPVLPDVLARTRDTDAANRKLVYTHVLEKHCTGSGDDARVGHVTVRGKELRELRVGDAPGQVAYIDLGHSGVSGHEEKNRRMACRAAGPGRPDPTHGRRMQPFRSTCR